MAPTDPYPDGSLPPNVVIGSRTLVRGENAFKRFYAERERALVIGACCTMDGATFAVGREGVLTIGDYCHFTNAVLLCELEVVIGSYVFIGWNATIADADFHPLEPSARMADAMALSPLGKGRLRPPFPRARVIIEDDVWVGPMAAILKGVRIGAGSLIEPGSVVTQDVPPGSRVLGNPARVLEQT